MNKEYLLLKYESRLNLLLARGDKNVDSGGVVRKLRRKLRNLNK